MRTTQLVAACLMFSALLACKKLTGGDDSEPIEVATNPNPTTTPAPTGTPSTGDDLAGSYTIASGTNPNGSPYKGSVDIAKTGDAYFLTWTTGNTSYKGVGVKQGSVLGVGWNTSGAAGVAVYQIDGGKLEGKWAAPGSGGKLGSETLEGPAGLNGTYKITDAYSPDSGGKYEGSVTITPQGDTYAVSWNLTREKYAGVGIKTGNVLSVSFPAEAGVVAYDTSGGSLDGKWAEKPGASLGSEKLAKN